MERQELVESCIISLKQGILTEEKLREAFKKVSTARSKTRQNILYLFGDSSSLNCTVVGMAIMENGVLSDGPVDSAEWPYKKVCDAVKDGWSIIHFPRTNHSSSEKQEYVPNEFILEKIEEVL